jgi:beta-aspartyl-peptidase (threonine type)
VSQIAFIVHGGAGTFLSELLPTCKEGIQAALESGWKVLIDGGSALEACERAIVDLENDPVFDAGTGSHLNRDGKVQMDAILMDGITLKAGAVVAVERIRNPIQLAKLVLERSEHMLLAAAGAEQFAHEHGFELCNPRELVTEYEAKLWSERSGGVPSFGTVGAVALDMRGSLASGTSTGGTFYKHPGRVGDSPLIGCGCYADNLSSAVSCTGHGESIMKVVLAKTVSDLIAGGRLPQEAADASIELLQRRTGGRGGLIVLDRSGHLGIAHSTPQMVFAFKTSTASGIFDIGS